MSTLQITESGPVIQVVLNRPDVRNAFNEALIGELTAWAQRVGGKGSARVAVLSGAGKVFCAGADLMWMTKMVDYSAEENVRDARALAGMFQALNDMPIPLKTRSRSFSCRGCV
jgi:methylglutaconyl-CoA hydratase